MNGNLQPVEINHSIYQSINRSIPYLYPTSPFKLLKRMLDENDKKSWMEVPRRRTDQYVRVSTSFPSFPQFPRQFFVPWVIWESKQIAIRAMFAIPIVSVSRFVPWGVTNLKEKQWGDSNGNIKCMQNDCVAHKQKTILGEKVPELMAAPPPFQTQCGISIWISDESIPGHLSDLPLNLGIGAEI